MENGIFRKKSLERVSSPEQLNDAIRVTGPGVWLLLGAIAALLAGALLFAVFGRLETKLELPVAVGEGGAVCYVREDRAAELAPGMDVAAGGAALKVASVADEPVRAEDALDDYAMHLGGFEPGDWVYPVALDGEPGPGAHTASVTLESVSPISFILN